MTVDAFGDVTFIGSLADGKDINQSSVVTEDGSWPFYVPLYRGNGSLWSWNRFTNGTITGGTNASWINSTNPSLAAFYRSGFTNPALAFVASTYNPTNKPLLSFNQGQVILDGENTSPITNQITLTSNDTISLTATPQNANNLALTINRSTGAIHGTFANPSDPHQTLQIKGAFLQNRTRAC